MSRLSRPSGLPKRIPAWAWKWLRWRANGKKKPAPAPTPAPKPPTPAPRPKPKPQPFKALEGVDGVSVPSGAELKKAGKHFAGRYLSTPGNSKNVTKVEARDLHAHGIGIVLFFETTGTSFEGGRAAGVTDARRALAQLQELGVPTNAAVYFTIDADPHGHETQIVSYVKGAASVLGHARTGVYGGLGAIDACFKADACAFFCQAYAWSGGVWHKARHLEQYANGVHVAGHQVDLERQVKAHAGLWLP